MEYQFSYNLLGQPMAKCELECEAFGDWLSDDIGADMTKIAHLLAVIKQLQGLQLNHYQFRGTEYHLNMDSAEVELVLNNATVGSSATDTQTQQSDHQDIIQQELTTGCGLADVTHLLEAWQTFCESNSRRTLK